MSEHAMLIVAAIIIFIGGMAATAMVQAAIKACS